MRIAVFTLTKLYHATQSAPNAKSKKWREFENVNLDQYLLAGSGSVRSPGFRSQSVVLSAAAFQAERSISRASAAARGLSSEIPYPAEERRFRDDVLRGAELRRRYPAQLLRNCLLNVSA